jgi:DNA polymerase (family 10)
MTNSEIADQFSLLSRLMDIHGENSFKSSSYGNAAFNIDRLAAPIEHMSDAELFGLKGIGESTGKKIREIIATGKLPALEQLLEKTPPGLLDMLEIKGLGPKKIAVIWKELGAESLGELEYACNENRLVALKGFGAKTQESVLQNIAYFRQNLGFHLWREVEAFGNAIVAQLKESHNGRLTALTGAVRRQNETIEFVEIVTTVPKASLAAGFEAVPGIVTEDYPEMLQVHIPNQPRLRFYLTDKDAFYGKLFTTTGSQEFSDAFLKDYTLPERPGTEEDIFSANGLSYLPPALRETADDVTRTKTKIPDLVQPGDIKGIIHSHSTWSDGVHTIEAMAKAAKAQGLEYLVISDHSRAAFYAKGLEPERVAAQHREIDALNEKLAPFRIFWQMAALIMTGECFKPSTW